MLYLFITRTGEIGGLDCHVITEQNRTETLLINVYYIYNRVYNPCPLYIHVTPIL